MADSSSSYIVPGLVRGLLVLHTFDKSKKKMTMAEIAEEIGISRSSAFRLVFTLESLGYLKKVGSRYTLGSKVLNLGFRFLAGLDFIEPARPIMERLRDSTNMTVHLVIRDGHEIVFVERCQASAPFASTVSVGTRLPAYATSPGQIQLAGLSNNELEHIFAGVEMKAYTSATPCNLEELKARLEVIRSEPAVVSWGLFDPRISICTAPVYDQNKKVIAAVSVSCPLGMIPQSTLETTIRNQLVESSCQLSETIGVLLMK